MWWSDPNTSDSDDDLMDLFFFCTPPSVALLYSLECRFDGFGEWVTPKPPANRFFSMSETTVSIWGSRFMLRNSRQTRRDFLRIGALGLSGLTLPGLLRARAESAKRGEAIQDTSIIWLFLNGGPSQYETFDPKPGNPLPFRSVVGAVQTNVPGTMIGGLFKNLSQHADQFSLIRSYTHDSADHADATHYLMTGHPHRPAALGAAQIEPSIGSIVSRFRGPTNPKNLLPTYVRQDYIYGEGPDWLGASHVPFDLRGKAMENMSLKFSADRLSDRRGLLKEFDTVNRTIDQSGMMSALDEFEVRALDLVRGQAREAFDLSREDPKVRDRYGKGKENLGEKLLLARRLAEAGVSLINVRYGSWDSHGTNPSVGHGTIEEEMHKYVPELDRVLSTFLEDLYDRGLEKKILLAVVGEFGRTPNVDKTSGGRDHWPLLGNQLLAGGGMKMGQIIGSSTSNGAEPKSNPVSPNDLRATFFKFLGVPLDLQYTHPSGRPRPMLEDGCKPIEALW